MPSAPRATWHVLLAGVCLIMAMVGAGACSQPQNVHDTAEVRGQPCANCHAQAFLSAQNPKHVGVFPDTCGDCHNTRAWIPATPSGTVNHSLFPLTEKHASVACASCHTAGYQAGDTPATCVGCHQSSYDSAMNPPHAGFPTTCGDCHSESAWVPATVSGGGAHHPWFPLVNKHATVACASCHTKGYQPGDTPTACVGCHQTSYDTATNPPHAGFPTTCGDCHNDSGWVPATVSGSGATSHPWFPLVNRHAGVACASCHTSGYQAGDTPTACVGCHQTSYDTAASPPHAGLPTACASCHNDLGWSPSLFVHPWTLDGAHTTTPCVSCHTGAPPRYAGTPTACVGCHLANYQSSTFPGHNMFPQTCADCHSTTAWTPASGGVHPEANFPITTGSHASSAIICTDCHIAALGSPVKGQNTDCVHCHLQAHMQPSIDTTHTLLKVANYPGPNASSPSFCLSCHPKG